MAHRNFVPPRYEAFLSGELKVEDLDDEELRRGQLRDRDGGFKGRPSNVVPREFHKAIADELITRANGKMTRYIDVAVGVLMEIAENKRAPAVARNQAAIYLMERVVGKIPDKVQQEIVMKKYENDLEAIVEDD